MSTPKSYTNEQASATEKTRRTDGRTIYETRCKRDEPSEVQCETETENEKLERWGYKVQSTATV